MEAGIPYGKRGVRNVMGDPRGWRTHFDVGSDGHVSGIGE